MNKKEVEARMKPGCEVRKAAEGEWREEEGARKAAPSLLLRPLASLSPAQQLNQDNKNNTNRTRLYQYYYFCSSDSIQERRSRILAACSWPHRLTSCHLHVPGAFYAERLLVAIDNYGMNTACESVHPWEDCFVLCDSDRIYKIAAHLLCIHFRRTLERRATGDRDRMRRQVILDHHTTP